MENLKAGVTLFLCVEENLLGLARYSGNDKYKEDLEKLYKEIKNQWQKLTNQ